MLKKNLSVPVHHNVSAMVLPADDLADYNPHYIDLILNITSRHTETNIYLTHLYSRYNLLTITTIPISHWTIIVLPLLQYLSISVLYIFCLLENASLLLSFFCLFKYMTDRIMSLLSSIPLKILLLAVQEFVQIHLKDIGYYMWKGH